MKWFGTVLLISCALLLLGARSPVPMDAYVEVDHGLDVSRVMADPDLYRGRVLLLGGKVIRTLQESSGVTLEIACYRLDSDDRPVVADGGCDTVLVRGEHLDSATYRPGRMVTLTGEVAGRVRLAEEAATARPLLTVRFLHPWPTAEEEAAARERYPPPYWHDPWYDPWYDPWRPFPYRRHPGWYGPRSRFFLGTGYDHHH